MIEKFRGSSGRRLLVAALRKQEIVANSLELATELADVATLQEFWPKQSNSSFIREGENDDDIYLILSGRVSIRIGGGEIAQRGAGEHVGEMSCIDTSKVRSATVTAIEPTVVAKFTEPQFSALADKYPNLWRLIALNLGEKLRERSKHVIIKNHRPKIFVSSCASKDMALPIVRAIQSCFAHDDFEVIPWMAERIKGGGFPIDDLIRNIGDADFSIVVLTDDDTTESPEKTKIKSPRDNCILELGMAYGALGRDRTFFVIRKGVKIKIPTDLAGITPLELRNNDLDKIRVDIEPVCTAIRERVACMSVK